MKCPTIDHEFISIESLSKHFILLKQGAWKSTLASLNKAHNNALVELPSEDKEMISQIENIFKKYIAISQHI